MARDLMLDEEWALFERFILAVRAPNGRKLADHRLVFDGIFFGSLALAPHGGIFQKALVSRPASTASSGAARLWVAGRTSWMP